MLTGMKRALFLLTFLTTAGWGTAQPGKAQAPKTLRLYVFDCGSLNIPDTAPYHLTRDQVATNMMSVECFLIVHPKGAMIWDAGAVPDTSFKAGGGPATLRYGTSSKPLAAQLAEAGYTPADIKYLALSHFH